MSNRLLAEGSDVTYDGLKSLLEEGEVLVATWLRDPANTPNARTNIGPDDVLDIMSATTFGYYVKTRWFASSNPSDNNYFSYNGLA